MGKDIQTLMVIRLMCYCLMVTSVYGAVRHQNT